MDISEEEAPFTKLTFKLGVRGNFTCASSNILYLCCYIIYLLHVIFFTCATCDILYLFPNRVKNSIASFVLQPPVSETLIFKFSLHARLELGR